MDLEVSLISDEEDDDFCEPVRGRKNEYEKIKSAYVESSWFGNKIKEIITDDSVSRNKIPVSNPNENEVSFDSKPRRGHKLQQKSLQSPRPAKVLRKISKSSDDTDDGIQVLYVASKTSSTSLPRRKPESEDDEKKVGARIGQSSGVFPKKKRRSDDEEDFSFPVSFRTPPRARKSSKHNVAAKKSKTQSDSPQKIEMSQEEKKKSDSQDFSPTKVFRSPLSTPSKNKSPQKNHIEYVNASSTNGNQEHNGATISKVCLSPQVAKSPKRFAHINAMCNNSTLNENKGKMKKQSSSVLRYFHKSKTKRIENADSLEFQLAEIDSSEKGGAQTLDDARLPKTSGKSVSGAEFDSNAEKDVATDASKNRHAVGSTEQTEDRDRTVAEKEIESRASAESDAPEPNSDGSSKDAESIDEGFLENAYYLEYFITVTTNALMDKHNWSLFSPEEVEQFATFGLLPTEAQKLYTRLFNRKVAWLRGSHIKYREISDDLTPVLGLLVEKGFLDSDTNRLALDDALALLRMPELLKLAKEYRVCVGGTANKKKKIIEQLLKISREQTSILGLGAAKDNQMDSILKRRVLKTSGPCYRLAEAPRKGYSRAHHLFSLPNSSADNEDDEIRARSAEMLTFLLVSRGQMKFPEYTIKKSIPIFSSRQCFLRYEAATELYSNLRSALERKEWKVASDLSTEAHDRLKEVLEDNDMRTEDARKPLFLRRFTAGARFCYAVEHGLEAFQRLRNYETAARHLQLLLSQEIYSVARRGHWFDRLALILDQHLKKYDDVVEVLAMGMSENVHESYVLALAQRAVRLSKGKKLSSIVSPDARKKLAGARSLLCPPPKHSSLEATSLHRSTAGLRLTYLSESPDGSPGTVVVSSVEEFVLSYYKRQDYTEGIHGEGSTVATLFGLYFWDVLYDCVVPDVFRTSYQRAPLDLASPEFYKNRQELVDARVDAMKNWSLQVALDVLQQTWEKNHGTISLVAWDRFRSVEHAQGLISCFGMDVLAAICKRLAKNYRQNRSGFPDLIVWNPTSKAYKIVEVKGPNDQLSHKQMEWLRYLSSYGAEAEVCYVKTVSSKKISAKGKAEPATADEQSTPTVENKATADTEPTQPVGPVFDVGLPSKSFI